MFIAGTGKHHEDWAFYFISVIRNQWESYYILINKNTVQGTFIEKRLGCLEGLYI